MSDRSLGKMVRPATGDSRPATVLPLQKLLPSGVFSELWTGSFRPGTVLVPEVVFWLMIAVALGDGSMSGAMAGLWGTMRTMFPWIPIKPLTEEAFCIARRKLPREFFRKVFCWVVSAFDRRHGDRFLWKGHRLLGIDGMKTSLPHSRELKKRYPGPSNQHGTCGKPQGLLVGLVGLFTGICHGFLFLPEKRSEPRAGSFLTRLLRAGDILLADPNFTGIQMLLSVVHREADFVMRLASRRYAKHARRPTRSGRKDEYYIDIPIPVVLQRMFPACGESLTVRIVEYQIKGFHPSRLVTTLLDTFQYTHDELVGLYHERWRQETHHREWKYSLRMGNLRSRSRDGILKEVFAQLTLNNLIRWMQAEAIQPPMRPVDLQFLACKRLVIAAAYPIGQALANGDLRGVAIIYNDLLKEMASKRILVRPGRSYARKHDTAPRNKGNGTFAQPRRLAQPQEAQMLCI